MRDVWAWLPMALAACSSSDDPAYAPRAEAGATQDASAGRGAGGAPGTGPGAPGPGGAGGDRDGAAPDVTSDGGPGAADGATPDGGPVDGATGAAPDGSDGAAPDGSGGATPDGASGATPDAATADAGTDGGGLLPCGNDGTAWPPGWQELECELAALIDTQRAQGATCDGTPVPARGQLLRSQALTTNARTHSADMAEHGYASVINSSAEGPAVWAPRGHSGGWRAAMVAIVESDPADVLATLMADPTTCSNVMAEGATIGVGYFHQPVELDDAGMPTNPANFVHYWTIVIGG